MTIHVTPDEIQRVKSLVKSLDDDVLDNTNIVFWSLGILEVLVKRVQSLEGEVAKLKGGNNG